MRGIVFSLSSKLFTIINDYRWKTTIMELNDKFQNEMKRLHEQIVHLESSNQKLKSQLLNVMSNE